MFKQIYGSGIICSFAGCKNDAHYLVTFTCCTITRHYCLKDCIDLDHIYDKKTVKCGQCAKTKKFDKVTYV